MVTTRRKPIPTLVAIVLTTMAMVLGVSATVLTIVPAGVASAQGEPGDPGDGSTPGGNNPPGEGPGPNGPGGGTDPGGIGPGDPGNGPTPGGGGEPGGGGPGIPGGGPEPGGGNPGGTGPLDQVRKLNAATATHAAETKAATAKLNAAIRSGDRTKIRAAQAEILAANKKLQSSIQGIVRPSSG